MALIRPQLHVDATRRGYDGSELRSHWIYETLGVRGDAVAAFVGPVEVRGDHLVDLEDRLDGLFIAGSDMLHFIVESFGADLDRAVLLQRLLVVLARERLIEAGVSGTTRKGDDIYVGEGKLSVSIATVSTVSCLIHLGLNVSNEGTPVKTAALGDFGIEPLEFARGLAKGFADEIESVARATTKVRGVL